MPLNDLDIGRGSGARTKVRPVQSSNTKHLVYRRSALPSLSLLFEGTCDCQSAYYKKRRTLRHKFNKRCEKKKEHIYLFCFFVFFLVWGPRVNESARAGRSLL